MNYPHALRIDTDLDPDDLRRRLDAWAPWGHRVEFSNGVSTADCRRRTPFIDHPLGKLAKIADAVPLDTLTAALDVGCNSGHAAIALAGHGLKVTGIDIQSRHLEVTRFLAELAGADVEALAGDAESWERPGAFDLVVHFGTLYHLPNPIRSLQTAARNLQAGGWLALETQVYDHPDDPNLCYWMQGQNNDATNFFALSTRALLAALDGAGFVQVREILRVHPPALAEHMSRIILVGSRPEVGVTPWRAGS